jgi:putative DNA primase/helicase
MASTAIKKRVGGDDGDGWIRRGVTRATPQPQRRVPREDAALQGSSAAKENLPDRFKDGEIGLREWDGGDYQRLCSGIKWVGNVTDADGGKPAHAIDIWTLNGIRKRVEVPCELIDHPSELVRHLTTQGMKIERDRDAARRIGDYLFGRPLQPAYIRATIDGWQTLNNTEAYVLGSKAYCTPNRTLLVTRTPPTTVRQQSGTLAQWGEIVKLCTGNPLLIVSLCAAFASALLHPFGRNAFGISFVGRSSTGKTTALRLALALFDSPSNLANWVSTANGLEALAAQYSHMPLVLDEIGLASREVMTDAAYRLTNGSGKIRAVRNGGLASIARISSVSLTAGEESVVERIEYGGRQAKLGQYARFITFISDYSHGAFADLHGESDGAAFAEKLSRMLQATHGVAWEPFVQYLAENIHAVKAKHAERENGIKEHLTTGIVFDRGDGVCARVLDNFALMYRAGIVARLAGVFPIADKEIINALRHCFRKWHKQYQQRQSTPDETILDEVRYFLQVHRNKLPPLTDYDNPERDTKIGFTYTQRDGTEVFLIFPGALDALIQKHGHRAFHDALVNASWLLPGSGNRLKQQYPVSDSKTARPSLYTFKKAVIYAE